eukprot:1852126-Amphidinium_carterae.1
MSSPRHELVVYRDACTPTSIALAKLECGLLRAVLCSACGFVLWGCLCHNRGRIGVSSGLPIGLRHLRFDVVQSACKEAKET